MGLFGKEKETIEEVATIEKSDEVILKEELEEDIIFTGIFV